MKAETLAGVRPGVRCCRGAAAVGMEVGAGLETWSRARPDQSDG